MTMKEARTMVERLRALETSAPQGISAGVLSAVGLVDAWTELAGPIGGLYVAWTWAGIAAVERSGDPEGFETEYRLRHGRSVRRVPAMPARMAAQVQKRLHGERTSGPPMDLGTMTEFEQAVLRKTMEIPYGEVRPYSWIAREIERPRAVECGLCNNPCPSHLHRVVRADGHIGQYGAGGPEAKREVLHVEGIDTAALEQLAGRGVRFTGSDTTNIYCYPSCRHARRTLARHVVPFDSAEEALTAGYRPCRVCRPLEAATFAA
jgi:O6-methylguanine-DNA--protein-cysteine methyltransferase